MKSTSQAATTAMRFQTLWDNYPRDPPCVNPHTNKKAYENQCAIRLGYALQKSGVNFSGFKGGRCEFGPPGNGMALRAQELADWLRTRPFSGCPAAQIYSGKLFQTTLAGKSGIVFFQDYWRRPGERSPTGDHIDLWNKNKLTPSIETALRFSFGISRIPMLYSDLASSRQIVFWMMS